MVPRLPGLYQVQRHLDVLLKALQHGALIVVCQAYFDRWQRTGRKVCRGHAVPCAIKRAGRAGLVQATSNTARQSPHDHELHSTLQAHQAMQGPKSSLWYSTPAINDTYVFVSATRDLIVLTRDVLLSTSFSRMPPS